VALARLSWFKVTIANPFEIWGAVQALAKGFEHIPYLNLTL
jgi:hypothetical protein